MSSRITYCFVSPFPTKDTVDLIEKAFLHVGRIREADAVQGRLSGKYRVSAFRSIRIDFYVQRDNETCKVRAIINEELLEIKSVLRRVDGFWDNFLVALFQETNNADFGVTLANENARIVGVLYLGGDTEQVQTSRTTKGTSLLGFLAGGALFGTAGAVVGGMSGKQRTVSHSFEQFSDSQLARVIYNNGRLWEGELMRGSDLYNEIMVNL